jgi:hypothetical protein
VIVPTDINRSTNELIRERPMTIRLTLPDGADDLVAFGCSPAHEALRSLHVLAAVRRHPLHISWALATRAALPKDLAAELDRYAFWFAGGPVLFPRLLPVAQVRTWEEEMAVLRAAPVEDFAEPLLHRALAAGGPAPRVPWADHLRSPAARAAARATVEAAHAPSVAVLDALHTDPAGSRDRFADFLQAYWDAALAVDWPRMQGRLEQDVARRGRALSRRGVRALLVELSPHLRADPGTGELVVRPPGAPRATPPLDVTLGAGDQLVLVPSHFVWPELAATVRRDRLPGREEVTVEIVHSIAEFDVEARTPVPPDRLLKLLRSAGDPRGCRS